jgi:hypothetical protein
MLHITYPMYVAYNRDYKTEILGTFVRYVTITKQ